VRSTIELGHNLGLRVVAEGVEDSATLRTLRAWGCDIVQGFGISRPISAEATTAWLETRPGQLALDGELWRATDACQPVLEERAC
jgi:diguanylate cyclase